MAVGRGKTVWLSGVAHVNARFGVEIGLLKQRARPAMVGAGLIVKGAAIPLTPIKTGNLRGGAYTRPTTSRGGWPGVEIGYTAEYAPMVHEVNKRYRVGQWKFLETALKQKKGTVLKFLGATMRIPIGGSSFRMAA